MEVWSQTFRRPDAILNNRKRRPQQIDALERKAGESAKTACLLDKRLMRAIEKSNRIGCVPGILQS